MVTSTPTMRRSPPMTVPAVGRSPRKSHAVAMPLTGTRRVNGTTAEAGWRARREFHTPYPKSEHRYAV